MVGVRLAQRLGIEVLVAHAPRVLEGNQLVGGAGLVHDTVAVSGEEGVHVVEIAPPPIEEDAVVATVLQLPAQARVAGFAARALDDGAARCRGHGQGDGLQAPDGARAGRVEIAEEKAPGPQPVQVGRQLPGVPERAEVVSAQTLDRDHDDIEGPELPGVVDGPADIQGIAAQETGAGLGRLPAQQFPDFLVGQCRVELPVVDLVVAEGRKELERPVGGEFAADGVPVRAGGKVLPGKGGHQQAGGHQARQERQGLAPGEQGRAQGLADHIAQQGRARDGDDDQQRHEGVDRVGLEDVVDDLPRIDEVVHGDEVEAHPEFVPEQPLRHGRVEHDEKADGDQRAQEPLMPGVPPDGRGAERQVQGQGQRRVDEKAQVVDETGAEDGQHA